MVSISAQQQQQPEEDASSSKNAEQIDGNGVSNTTAAVAAAVISEEQCNGDASTIEQANNNDDNNDPSLMTNPLQELNGETTTAVTNSPPLAVDSNQVVNAPTEETAEAAQIIQTINDTKASQQHQQQQQVEIIVNNSNMETKDTTTQKFIQYQQQEQSISSDSLVQLDDESLKQPVLLDDNHKDDDDYDVEEKKIDLEEEKQEVATTNQQQGQDVVVDATTITGASSTLQSSQKNNHQDDQEDVIGGKTSPPHRHHHPEMEMDNDNNNISSPLMSPVVNDLAPQIIDNCFTKLEQQQQQQQHQADRNSNDQDDDEEEEDIDEDENSPRTPTQRTPFLSPNRATMSLSPSLLMNNTEEEEESSSPSPPPHHQQQSQSPPPLHHYHHQGHNNSNNVISSPSRITYAAPPGRRSIKLRLLEEIPSSLSSPLLSPLSLSSKTPFKSFRQMGRIRSLSLTGSLMNNTRAIPYLDEKKSSLTTENNGDDSNNNMVVMDRGTITVSWYDGTTSTEMQEHVFGCVLRRLNQSGGKLKLEDVRLLDENVEPHEEVVLCPFLPDGSQFLLRFRTVEDKPERTVGNNITATTTTAFGKHHPFASRPPDSPSAEPSPHPSNANLVSLGGIHPQQLQLLNAAAAALLRPPPLNLNSAAAAAAAAAAVAPSSSSSQATKNPSMPAAPVIPDTNESNSTVVNGTDSTTTAEERTDDLIEQQLRQLNELFLQRRSGSAHFAKSSNERNDDLAEEEHYHREEKKQVIFLIGNYLVLFMSLIALSAEIQSRLPQMMKWVQENYDSVQNCATDRDALVDCLSKGDFSGLVASFLLWATQSVAAKRIFLFGFDTPKKLWTVVYEALVSAVCWGISYLFIRRGLNPNTRQNFVHKYWKDAVYGSLAGFNAAFLKAVLKNLVPQDVALEALEGRQLKIFHWLGTLLADE